MVNRETAYKIALDYVNTHYKVLGDTIVILDLTQRYFKNAGKTKQWLRKIISLLESAK